MPQLTQDLAQLIQESRFEHFSETEREQSAKIIADTLAVTIGGARSELRTPLQTYLRLYEVAGTSRVLGTDWRLPSDLSALANGTFAAALDFDDVMPMMPGHPSAIVIGVAASQMDSRTISGRSLIEAHIVGIEVGAKLGLGLTRGHYDRGFHGTGTLGVFVGVAALAKLRNLDVPTIRTALGIASSMSSGLRCNFGTMTKALHSGWAAQWAVNAVDLAESGFTACATALEAEAGYFATYGVAESEAQAVLSSWGAPWAINEPGIGLRKFACYNALQRPMHAVVNLLDRGEINEDSLESMTCWMHPGGMQGAIHPNPATGFEGKFSLQYVLAAGVLDGQYSLETFTDHAVSRPAIKELLTRIQAWEQAECAHTDPDAIGGDLTGANGFVQVSLKLKSGETHTCRVSVAPGHPARPLSWDDLEEKLSDCAKFAHFSESCSRDVFLQLRKLAQCDDIRSISDLLVERGNARAVSNEVPVAELK